MAKKSDFTEQEWESLQKGVVGAGLLVSLSDRSFFDSFKEAGALAKHGAAAKQSNTSELVRALAKVRGNGFGLTPSPDQGERETGEAWQPAKPTRRAEPPDGREPHRQSGRD